MTQEKQYKRNFHSESEDPEVGPQPGAWSKTQVRSKVNYSQDKPWTEAWGLTVQTLDVSKLPTNTCD